MEEKRRLVWLTKKSADSIYTDYCERTQDVGKRPVSINRKDKERKTELDEETNHSQEQESTRRGTLTKHFVHYRVVPDYQFDSWTVRTGTG